MSMIMGKMQHFFVTILLVVASVNVSAGVGNPELGKEYRVLQKAQSVDVGKKIEVIEFFAYYCPHCSALEPLMTDWVKKQGDRIVFKRIHVSVPGLETQSKLYYTLEAMGKVEEYQTKAFNAFHLERNRLQNDADIRTFVEKAGIDKAKFFGIYNSFAVQSKMSRASQLVTSYEVDSWPKLSIDGRYITAPSMAASTMGRVTEIQQNQALFPVLDWLLAKVQKEKQVTPAVAASEAAASANKTSKIKAVPNKK